MTVDELKSIQILKNKINVIPKAITNYNGFYLIMVDDISDEYDSYYIVNVDTEDIVKWSPAYDLEGYKNIIKNNLFKSI